MFGKGGIRLQNKDYLKYLEEFVDIFIESPVMENAGGMQFNHSYFTYFVFKELKPELAIESGVWKGHSTYIIESASPKSQIISLDPDLSNIIYKSNNAEYFNTDFNDIDWQSFDGVENSLCFFDDHQNSLERMKEMKWWGFKRALFEDNFPIGEGDFYSIKQIINNTGHPNIQLSKKYMPKLRSKLKERKNEENVLNKYYFRQNMIVKPNNVDKSGFDLNVKDYFEFPPIYTEEISYWGEPWKDNYKRLDNLINSNNINNYPKFKSFFNKYQHKFDYGFISYLELN